MSGYLDGRRQVGLYNTYDKDQIDSKFADKTSLTAQDFATMPTVGGDPVVESGSNADGEWTRWADGLIVQSTVVSTINNDTTTGTEFNFPQPLATAIGATISAGSTGQASGSVGGSYLIESSLVSPSIGRVKVLLHQDTIITGPDRNVRVLVTGYWK